MTGMMLVIRCQSRSVGGRARLGLGGLMARMGCMRLGLGGEGWAARGTLTQLSVFATDCDQPTKPAGVQADKQRWLAMMEETRHEEVV